LPGSKGTVISDEKTYINAAGLYLGDSYDRAVELYGAGTKLDELTEQGNDIYNFKTSKGDVLTINVNPADMTITLVSVNTPGGVIETADFKLAVGDRLKDTLKILDGLFGTVRRSYDSQLRVGVYSLGVKYDNIYLKIEWSGVPLNDDTAITGISIGKII
jgi:hypothetical protein